MKIAHINMFYYPTIGGVEQVMKELAERQVKAGHEVHVFCCDSDKNSRIDRKEETVNGVYVHRLPYWFRLSLSTFVWPSLLWRFKGKFDIIHSHVSGHDYVLFAGHLAKKTGARHIHTTHCPWTDASFRPLVLRPFMFLNNLFVNKMIFKRVDKIVAITPWELSTLKNFVEDEEKITVIPNGADEILYKKAIKNNFRKKYKIKEKKIVLFFGRLNPTKGPEKLALAALEISKKRKDIAFLWVGPDEGKLEEVKQLIKGHKNMKYIPPIRDKKKIAEMYQAADVYVLPSYREGLPLTLFEAFASKLPVVASPVNGVPYEMKEGENGFFADYGDIEKLKENILKLVDNKNLARQIGKTNYEKAQNYRWDNIAKRYENEYKKLLGKK
ncbi:hypothetical protein A3K73_01735 [Candidatus Pacearchaeota archaeon RBG_13_36_9]|nr:MAG: hypothetical protein A3K73_01735 [Candidatus Pacearchaeota archaeon RBG_13_36_9]